MVMTRVLLFGLWAVVLMPASATASDVTFNKDVLPILQQHCQVCHRPGEIGPMPFLTYDATRPWARAIKSAVVSKKMPPWFADPTYGLFANQKRLTESEIAVLSAWADNGAPEGSPVDRPAALQFRDGWNIRPDLVFQLPKPLKIPARGTVEYTYVAVSAPFKEDTWVAAGEIRPSDRAHVHHVIAMVRPKGSKWMEQAQLGAEPWAPGPTRQADMLKANKGDASVLTTEFFVGYVPGMEAQRFDIDRSAKLIPAGADIVLEVHYTTNGTEGEDQTKVGLELAPAPPERLFLSVGAAQPNLTIPPGDPNAEAKALVKFGQPVDLVYMQPHMHLRGKDMRIDAQYPTGERETLLSVPRYDFNWQIVYYERKPLHLPKGTELHLTAHWDNSTANKWNPDPTATVHWGDQSWQEMLSAPMAVIVDRSVDPKTVIERGGFQAAAGAQ
jgi:mono/diheme cytochrome c family protein